MFQISTARLVLRALEAADVDAHVALWVDPDVTRYMGGPRETPRVRQALDDALQIRSADPHWTVVEKASGRIVGECALTRKDVDGRAEIELTYVFAKVAWGKGYATEAAAAIRDHAFRRLGVVRLIALIHPENEASAHVAEKLGMHLEREIPRPGGTRRRVYALHSPLKPSGIMLLIKNLLFTVLVPGTAGVLIPLRVARRSLPAPSLELWSIVGLLLLAAGAVLYAWCLWEFAVTGRGTPAPVDPPRTLVVRGPYRVVRNPIYVSALTVVVGWGAYLHSTQVIIYAVGMAIAFHLFIVFYEEPTLQNKFGDSYMRYRQTVRRWFPVRPS